MDREKSGDAPGGKFSPGCLDYERHVSYHSSEDPGGDGCDFVNVPESCNQRDDRDNYTL